jgi:hypothetical protein
MDAAMYNDDLSDALAFPRSRFWIGYKRRTERIKTEYAFLIAMISF